jgi:signal transduction histidine kinase
MTPATDASSDDRPIAEATVENRPGRARRLRTALAYPLLSLLYAVSGRLGLLLAVPPGYATAIFPPAGIAAAAMLIAGPASLPWTFLGSFGLNVWIGAVAGRVPPPTALAAAALIAAASTAQAALSGWALRRVIGYPLALDNGGQVVRFLSLAPLCCLTSASLSVAGLAALGIVTQATLAASWAAWWVGDTLGVMVVLPLTLVLVGEPRGLWRARFRPVALPMPLFFAFFVAVFIRVSAWENDEQMLQFRLVSQQALDRIRTGLQEQAVFLHQLERSFSRKVPIERADFDHLVRSMLQDNPTVQAVEWAPRVGNSDRAAFEAAQHGGFQQFAIREIAPPGQPQRAGMRANFYPVIFVTPSRGNEGALGLDLAAGSKREAAVARALASGAVTATAPIPLGQGPNAPMGLLLLLAVRDGGSGSGLVAVTIRVPAFLGTVLRGTEPILRLSLVDAAERQVPFAGSSGEPSAEQYRQEFEFGQRRFIITTEPSVTYLATRRGWQSWALLSAGVLGTGLLGALLLLGTGYAHRIHAQVEERTRDLAMANRQLRIEIDERLNAEAALRQAQRMEAIGKLTGGIAHDFNNLLTVVSANAELLLGDPGGERVQRGATAILRAAARGARLTRHLLAFSRRQTLRPELVDLRQRASEIGEMLGQALRDDIVLTIDMADDLWPVAIDPVEFDLAILNIAVNARDAMPDGGRFRIVGRNRAITAAAIADGLVGDFVALRLSDTGAGMSSEVLAHAFDPYFTTKPIGAGSGLGLSQVYGFAKQSGGGATIVSEPEAGTSVNLFLRRAHGDAAGQAGATAVAAPEASGG